MNILHQQVNDWRKDQAHQIIQHRRRLAPQRIGKEAEAEEAEQGADVLHQPDQSYPALGGKARSICHRSEIAGNKTRNAPIADCHRERRKHADQKHVAPRAGAGRPNDYPDGGGKNASNRVSALQKRAKRALSDQSSAVIDAPVAHSEPIASPTRKRSTAKDSQSQDSALKPVSSE